MYIAPSEEGDIMLTQSYLYLEYVMKSWLEYVASATAQPIYAIIYSQADSCSKIVAHDVSEACATQWHGTRQDIRTG